MSNQPIPTHPRPGLIESPIVTELRLRLQEQQTAITGLREDTSLLKDALALLTDANADLLKENLALRADLKDARHDMGECLKELNRRDDDSHGT